MLLIETLGEDGLIDLIVGGVAYLGFSAGIGIGRISC